MDTRYSPIRRSSAQKASFLPVTPRLACVKPVASVHPEPGSNSSSYFLYLGTCRPIAGPVRPSCLILSDCPGRSAFYRIHSVFFLVSPLCWQLRFNRYGFGSDAGLTYMLVGPFLLYQGPLPCCLSSSLSKNYSSVLPEVVCDLHFRKRVQSYCLFPNWQNFYEFFFVRDAFFFGTEAYSLFILCARKEKTGIFDMDSAKNGEEDWRRKTGEILVGHGGFFSRTRRIFS